MALSKTEIDAVVREISSILVGGWIQKLSQPYPESLMIDVRTPGHTYGLFVSVEPALARLHLTDTHFTNPPTPPTFCQYLRAHIQGSRIEQVEQVAEDRVVRIMLQTKEGPRVLLIALTGKSANLFILDTDEKVLAILKKGSQHIGQPYVRPLSPLIGRRESEHETDITQKDQTHYPISHAIEQRYQQKEQERHQERSKTIRLAQIRKAIKKTKRRIQGLQTDIEKSSQYQGYDRYGELLKGHLAQIAKGQTSITVSDYFDDQLPELVIPLDPGKTPQGNMETYFKKYRKFEATEREIRPRLLIAEQNLLQLQKDLKAIHEDSWIPDEAAMPSVTGPAQSHTALPIPRKKQASQRSGPFKKFLSTDDIPIYVGRNAKENEELTHKFAHSDDLWLHARGTPGSHVIIRAAKGTEVPHQTLCDAATLALQYSDLKKSGKGDVIYTKKKWVKKAKGQPAGTVLVTQEKSLFVKIDPARLEALKSKALKESST